MRNVFFAEATYLLVLFRYSQDRKKCLVRVISRISEKFYFQHQKLVIIRVVHAIFNSLKGIC